MDNNIKKLIQDGFRYEMSDEPSLGLVKGGTIKATFDRVAGHFNVVGHLIVGYSNGNVNLRFNYNGPVTFPES